VSFLVNHSVFFDLCNLVVEKRRKAAMYRGAPLIRKCTPLGPCGRPMPRVLGGPRRVGIV